MSTRPNGLDSGLAMLDDMLAAGMLTEEERQKAAIAHLRKVYGIEPVVYDFPCLGCHEATQRERSMRTRSVSDSKAEENVCETMAMVFVQPLTRQRATSFGT